MLKLPFMRPNEQDLVRRAAAWRTRSVEQNRCVQAAALWGLQEAAVGWRGCERVPGARAGDPGRASRLEMAGDCVRVTMSEGRRSGQRERAGRAGLSPGRSE